MNTLLAFTIKPFLKTKKPIGKQIQKHFAASVGI
jgi:hypothetical protein